MAFDAHPQSTLNEPRDASIFGTNRQKLIPVRAVISPNLMRVGVVLQDEGFACVDYNNLRLDPCRRLPPDNDAGCRDKQ